MATIDQIAQLRLLIGEPDDAGTYTDAALGDRLDAQPDMDLLAYDIWTEKAASAAQLVDISEGGSSRKMGDLHEQALAMAETFRERAASSTTPPGQSGLRIKRISRP